MRLVPVPGLVLAFLALSQDRVAFADSERPLRVEPDARNVGSAPDRAPREISSTGLLSLSELAEQVETKKDTGSHRRGARPKVPRSQLPSDVPLSEANAKARQSIATGPTEEEIRGGPQEETLLSLRDAERVLFPEPVRGLTSNWSYHLPEREDRGETALGLPLLEQEPVSTEALSGEDVSWLKSLTLPDLPVRLDRRVVTYLKFYRDSHRGRTIAAIWARKSGRYVGEMKAQLRRAGLPTDLVWLSMIESGHNPTIASPAGAVGLWQFMPASGRMYGLTVDRWVDERRDPARSTQAAVRFLSDLYRRFGNWELSMGAYNMGYAGMSRAVEKYNTNDYWALSRMESGLPWETTLYVPKIFALAIVMNNKDAFGIAHIKPDPAVAFDTILVEPATPLEDIAGAAGMSKSELVELNPQYLASRLPPQEKDSAGLWPLRVPSGRGEQVLSRLNGKSASQLLTYRAKMGDNLELIANDYGLDVAALEKENSISQAEFLRPGTVLLLPASAREQKPDTVRYEVVATRQINPTGNQRRVFYRVIGDETLEEIADAFSASVSDLARWNVLNTRARLRPGMTVQLVVPGDRKLDHVRFVEARKADVLVSGSPEFHDYHESQKGKKRLRIVVKKGDTLSRIGARYGMSVGSMERVNRLSRRTELVEGQELIVYTDRKGSGVLDQEARALPEVIPPHPELLP